jgi:4-methyl-5(b-hydroxyethyl)-thiazole monophosphate biosynthesis
LQTFLSFSLKIYQKISTYHQICIFVVIMKGYILLAEGFETIEALTPLDILRRCGIDIKTVSVTSEYQVTSSHGLTVKADMLLEGLEDDADMLILPGGFPGYVNLRESNEVIALVQRYFSEGKIIGAICGAPTVLKSAGVGKGMKITCHSSVLDELTGNYDCTCADVECDGKVITGKGAGLSLPFALRLAQELAPAVVVEKVKQGLQLI